MDKTSLQQFYCDLSGNAFITSTDSSKSITTICNDGVVWLKAKEIATILEYKDPPKAIERHVCKEDKINFQALSARFKDGCDSHPSPGTNFKDLMSKMRGVGETSIPSIDPKTIFINECGFYDLVFKSKLPTAKSFKRWVYKEVIPKALNRRKAIKIDYKEVYDGYVESIDKTIDIFKKLEMFDDRDRINLKDDVVNMKTFCDSQRITQITKPPNDLNAIEYKIDNDLDEISVSLWYDMNYKNTHKMGKDKIYKFYYRTGRAMSAEYKRLNNKEPPKRFQNVGGTKRLVNHYVRSDWVLFGDNVMRTVLNALL